METQKRTKIITDSRGEHSEKAARMFSIYPPDDMSWNYSTEDSSDDTITPEANRDLLVSMGG
jgi:hypothetical protein